MAKRLTDTTKWDRKNFQDLSLKMKLVWFYLVDRCDHAGIWHVNLDLMSFQVGEKISIDDLRQEFGNKLVWLSDSKVFIPDFIDFQYGKLNSANRMHKSVIEILEKEGAYKALGSPLQGAKDKDKDKDKDKNKKKGDKKSLNAFPAAEQFTECVNLYREIKGTQRGAKAEDRFFAQISCAEDLDRLKAAIKHYRDFLRHPDNTWRKPKSTFETFLGTKTSGYFWHDWIEPPDNSGGEAIGTRDQIFPGVTLA